MKILVTGASGQLGSCIKKATEKQNNKINFVFKSSQELDITDFNAVKNEFSIGFYDYCINCAAYTQVDKAEDEKEKVEKINIQGTKNLSAVCGINKVILIHISTDFVFDGEKKNPYKEEDIANPNGIYGESKYLAEQRIIENLENYFIIRTSWLYSEYGHNFMKTMLRLGNEKKKLSVVNDQIGAPTYAMDLVEVILKIIHSKSNKYGVYHYSNKGVISWYDFAKAIFEISNLEIDLKSIPSSAYPTKAKRPKYSVLDSSKIKTAFKLEIPNWKVSLKRALKNVENDF